MDPNDASDMSFSALQESSSIALVAEKLGIEFRDRNSLKGYIHFLTSEIYMVISLIFLYFGNESSLLSYSRIQYFHIKLTYDI